MFDVVIIARAEKALFAALRSCDTRHNLVDSRRKTETNVTESVKIRADLDPETARGESNWYLSV
ncbi:MAG: hypothetical protein CMH56_13845 [Myxococcales bacterium]|nr:hypothetical protein [Myxococcales bacterium]|tara:strand:- start:264 stop:455 length:192 start_codon:yes stop_codon:yes gene_type:complete